MNAGRIAATRLFARVAFLMVMLCRAVFSQATFVAPEPEDLIFYQVFIDRFDNGNPANDHGNPRGEFDPSGPVSFNGGDLEGVRQRLAYIKGLGANAIWLSPLLENVREYHGYAAYNWYNVEPNFGDLAKLKQLVQEANNLGIAVFFDMVAGHCGDLIDSGDSSYPNYLAPPATYNLRWRSSLHFPPPFDSLDYFHAQGQISNFNDPEQVIGELFGLDDLKTETPYVREQMTAIWEYWMEQTGVSGFRIDTFKHVDIGFWEYFLPRLRTKATELGESNFFTFGEIFGADYSYMRRFVGDLNGGAYKLDAGLDFQFYYAVQDVFAHANASTNRLPSLMQSRAAEMGAHHLKTPNFIDNHDVRRFLNVAADNPGSGLAEQLRRLELALAFLLTAPGPPIIYYGTEQDFNGGNDPYNREDMYDGGFEFGPSLGDNFDDQSPHYRFVKRLADLRSQSRALRRGDFELVADTSSGPGVLAFLRTIDSEAALVALNTSASNSQTVPATATPWAQGAVVANFFFPSQTLVIGAGGTFPGASLAPQDIQIWIPADELPPVVPEVLA
ncbi:MAG: alpha-amylase family glycosyl hydrolase, partial [bacterium]